jgi:hypothetical protein
VRSPTPATPFSVSTLEKTDAQIQLARGRVVPKGDTGGMKVRDYLRPDIADLRCNNLDILI